MKKKDIQTLISVLENFREIDPGMNINMMLTFLEVARSGGVTGRSLEAALDLPQATAARMLRYFDRLYCNIDLVLILNQVLPVAISKRIVQ